MNRQLKSIAGALVVAALVAPAANAKDHPNAFAGLGHEGSGIEVTLAPNPFTGLGHEGSGLPVKHTPSLATGLGQQSSARLAKCVASLIRLEVTYVPGSFAGLGHEGSGLTVRHPPNLATGLESTVLVAKCQSILSRPWAN